MRDHGVHEAVMVDQVISNLIVNKKGSYADCNFGLGGHAYAILINLDSEAELIGIDRDPVSLEAANEENTKEKRFCFITDKVAQLEEQLPGEW